MIQSLSLLSDETVDTRLMLFFDSNASVSGRSGDQDQNCFIFLKKGTIIEALTQS